MEKKSFWTWRTTSLLILLPVTVLACVAGYRWWDQWQVRTLHASCTRAQRTHQWADLERLSEAWCRWRPESADAWLFRADAAQQQGKFLAAAEYLATVPDSDPKSLPADIALSNLQFGPLNRPLDGVQTCERILKQEPRASAAHQQLIEFYAMTMQRQKMIQQILYAIEMSREPPVAYVYLFLADSMRLANGVELNQAWLQTYPENELFLVAEALQLPEPISGTGSADDDKHRRIDGLFRQFPRNIELLAYQVEVAIRKGDVQATTDLLKRIPASEANDDRFWRAKGWLHLNREELTKAREALKRALELRPLDWNARSWLSDVERREGHLAEADRLQLIVRQARSLREAIIAEKSLEEVNAPLLSRLVQYGRACGETQLSDALERRLQSTAE